ncbi:MAG: phage integrase SAM-like domain-containing protein [Mangrovibacterium sp.]
MASIKLVLRDYLNKDGLQHVVVKIQHNKTSTTVGTDIFISAGHWDKENEKVRRSCSDPNYRVANRKLHSMVDDIFDLIDELKEKRILHRISAADIREYYLHGDEVGLGQSFIEYGKRYAAKTERAASGQRIVVTLNSVEAFDRNATIGDITKQWLYQYKDHRKAQVSNATTNIDLRNIRAILNHAINIDEINIKYPFRKFEFCKTEPRNLRLPADKIKAIRDFKTDVEAVALARDFFMLSFYLIGMNASDIYDIEQVEGGRIEYRRNKTRKAYSIRLEPEPAELIERRKGENRLLVYQERYANPSNLSKQINKHLKVIGVEELIMYHARHSWAGLSALHPISATKPLIAQALGHGATTVTDTYFDYDTTAVDELNRKVLDLIK